MEDDSCIINLYNNRFICEFIGKINKIAMLSWIKHSIMPLTDVKAEFFLKQILKI